MQTAIKIPERHGLKNLKPGRGRRWGSRNQIPIDLKRAIIAAAEAHGSDGCGTGQLTGYLYYLAARHPRAFAGLLARVLPFQVSGPSQSVVEQVTIVSVPAGHFLSKDVPPTDS